VYTNRGEGDTEAVSMINNRLQHTHFHSYTTTTFQNLCKTTQQHLKISI